MPPSPPPLTATRSAAADAEFSPECLVISLLYIERLRSLTGLHLVMSNWQPILLAAMVVSQKVRPSSLAFSRPL